MKIAVLAVGGEPSLINPGGTPKALVEIGGRPLLWHLLQQASAQGFDEFVVALGKGGYEVKRFVIEHLSLAPDIRVHVGRGTVDALDRSGDDWTIDLINTGRREPSAGRMRKLAPYLDDRPFLLLFGDNLSDLDLRRAVAFHQAHGKLATVVAVRPQARFGKLDLDEDRVVRFSEKSQLEVGWVNAGVYVLDREALQYSEPDQDWEHEPMERLAKDGELMAYQHGGFWHPVETLRDRKLLNQLWEAGDAPWKIW